MYMSIPLDPIKISKFTSELVKPPEYIPEIVKDPMTGEVISHNYTVSINQFKQQILPDCFPMTTVWGYSGTVLDRLTSKRICKFQNAPGPVLATLKADMFRRPHQYVRLCSCPC